MKWSDIDFGHKRIRVTSPKTEHHEGKGDRVIPMFPELEPLLLEAFDKAEEGAEHVVTIRRDAACNLRTRLAKIIRRAGVTPWPKLWHNLRASRQTELAERYPLHVVCQWIGNSAAIARDHYLQVTDAHFAQAVAEPPRRDQTAPARGRAEAAQNAAHSTSITTGTHREAAKSANENRPDLPSDSDQSRYLTNTQVGGKGFEPLTLAV